jgi:hypothetical protein
MTNTPMITLSLARRLLTALVLVAGASTVATAQAGGTPESRLAGRLDATTRGAVLAEVDSARAAGLPVGPLVDRALEGASKRALGRPVSGPDIVGAVRRLRGALGTARASLGPRATATELAAGASALQADVGASALVAIGRARAPGSLTVPLSVLTDLVALGVPTDTAARTVLSLLRTNDGVLLAYQRDVERDIGVGALPAVAASVRAAGLERATTESLNSPAPGGPPLDAVDAGKPRPPRKP